MSLEENQQRVTITIPGDRSWFDPRLINGACQIYFKDVPITGAASQLVAPQNTNRWAIGFLVAAGAGSLTIAPTPDPQTFPWFTTGLNSQFTWYTQFTYGPFIANKWYSGPSAGSTLRVFEVWRI